MSKTFRASIIISYYNGERFFKNFLLNIEEQSIFSDCEFLIDLNLPSKDVLDLVHEFSSRYPDNFRVFRAVKLKTIYQSWNFCINQANSDVLIIWNIDDIRTTNSLEMQCDFLDKNPDLDFVYSSFNIAINGDKKTAKFVDKSAIKLEELLTGMHLGPFYGYRKKVHDKIGYYDEQFKAGGDFDFAIRMASKFSGGCIKESLGWYWDEGKGLSTGRSITPILEKNIICYRYGIWEALEYQYLLRALKVYDANVMYFNGQPVKLSLLRPKKKYTAIDFYRGLRNTLKSLLINLFK